jgi:hypothetical protein
LEHLELEGLLDLDLVVLGQGHDSTGPSARSACS